MTGSAGTAGRGYRATCDLTACRQCTPCAHARHRDCRGTVVCPTDGVTRVCGCCRPTTRTDRTEQQA